MKIIIYKVWKRSLFFFLFSIAAISCSNSAGQPNDMGKDIIIRDADMSNDEGGKDVHDPDMNQNKDSDTNKDEGSEEDMTQGPCYKEVVSHENLQTTDIDEVSGLGVSPTQKVIWVHNDSGESDGRFYALSFDGKLKATFELDGATSIDWEDMELMIVDGKTYLYFSDTGDNKARKGEDGRDDVQVYRVEEPVISNKDPEEVTELTDFETYTFTYPDGATDCESLFVDPKNGDLFFLEKKNSGSVSFFHAIKPTDGTSIELEKLNAITFDGDKFPGNSLVTAGTISLSGDSIIVKTYTSLLLFPWGSGSFKDAVSKVPIILPRPVEIQGEAIGFGDLGDGYGLVSISEGNQPKINFIKDTCK